MKPLGVVLLFTLELLRLGFDEHPAVSLLEIEPQTLWRLSRAGGSDRYIANAEVCRRLAANPRPMLFHSVGLPVGSSRPLEPAQLELLGTMSRDMRPAWISDHLSFNSFPENGTWSAAGFFLPPRQDPATVAVAAAKLRALSRTLELPVAFETGVNYLRPRPEELPDGVFFSAVAEAADCGILLDLHNLWTNEINGRDKVEHVLARLPLERVWEVHLAGGMEYQGHWLDAHSGAIPEEVIGLASRWIPRLPDLGALVFEILDEHVRRLGRDGIERELGRLHQLWDLRPVGREIRVRRAAGSDRPPGDAQLAAVRAWETTLGGLAIGREPAGRLAARLRSNPGINVFRGLVHDARAGFISEGLHYTMSLLLAAAGPERVRELLAEYTRSRPPELFVSAEADGFARFLKQRDLAVPYLEEVLNFEHALVRAALYDQATRVHFLHEPTALFESLDQGRLPDDPVRWDGTMLVRAN